MTQCLDMFRDKIFFVVENTDVTHGSSFKVLYHNYCASALGGACAMGTNTMALIQTCQIQATAVKLQCCHIWQVELSKLSLLQLSFSIHSSNGVSCPIKFFHLKIAIGLALGDSWGVACASTEQHWCPVSTFACFAGKAFLGKPAKITFGENKEQGCQLHQKQE